MASIRDFLKKIISIVLFAPLATSLPTGSVWAQPANYGNHYVLVISDAWDFLQAYDKKGKPKNDGGKAAVLADALSAYLAKGDPGAMPGFRLQEDALSVVFASETWSGTGLPSSSFQNCKARFNGQRDLTGVFHDATTMPRGMGSIEDLRNWLGSVISAPCNGIGASIPVNEYAKFALPPVSMAANASGQSHPFEKTIVLVVENFTSAKKTFQFSDTFGQVSYAGENMGRLTESLNSLIEMRSVVQRGIEGNSVVPKPNSGHDFPVALRVFDALPKQQEITFSEDLEALQTEQVADTSKSQVYWRIRNPDRPSLGIRVNSSFKILGIDIRFKLAPGNEETAIAITAGDCKPPLCNEDGKHLAPFVGLKPPVFLKRESTIQVRVKGGIRSSLYDHFLYEKTFETKLPPPYLDSIETYAGPSFFQFMLGTALDQKDVFSSTPIEITDETLLRLARHISATDLVTVARVGQEIERARTLNILIPIGIVVIPLLALMTLLFWRRFDKSRFVVAEAEKDFKNQEAPQVGLMAVGRLRLVKVPSSRCKVHASVVSVVVSGCEMDVSAVFLSEDKERATPVSSGDFFVYQGCTFLVWIDVKELKLKVSNETEPSRQSVVKRTMRIGIDFARLWKSGDQTALAARPVFVDAIFEHHARTSKPPEISFAPVATGENDVPVYRRNPAIPRGRVKLGSANVLSGNEGVDFVRPVLGKLKCINVTIQGEGQANKRPVPEGVLRINDEPVDVLPGLPGKREITLDLANPVVLRPNSRLSFTIELQSESGQVFRSSLCECMLQDEAARPPERYEPVLPLRPPGFVVSLLGRKEAVLTLSSGHYRLDGAHYPDHKLPPLQIQKKVARGTNPDGLLDLYFEIEAAEQQVNRATLVCKVSSQMGKHDRSAVGWSEAKGYEKLVSFIMPTSSQELSLEVSSGSKIHVRLAFNNRMITNIQPSRCPVKGQILLNVMAKYEVNGVNENVNLIEQEIELLLDMDIALPFLAVDFGTSAIAVAHGRGSRIKLLELQRVNSVTNDPVHNLIQYDTINASTNPYFLSSSLFCRSDNFDVPAIVHKDSKPGYPASDRSSTELGAPEFIELPITNRRDVQWKSTIASRYINGIKAWLGIMTNRIDLNEMIHLRDSGSDFEDETNILPLDGLLRSAFAAVVSAYISPRQDIEEFGRVVVSHPNTFTTEQRETLHQAVVAALARQLGKRWKENDRVLLARESECVLMRYLHFEKARNNTFPPRYVMIYDLGAGTLDVTVAEAGWVLADNAVNPENPEIQVLASLAVNVAGHDLDDILTRFMDKKIKECLSKLELLSYYTPITDDVDLSPGVYTGFINAWQNLQSAKHSYSTEAFEQSERPIFLTIRLTQGAMTQWTDQVFEKLVAAGEIPLVSGPHDFPEVSGLVAMKDADNTNRHTLHIRLATEELEQFPLYQEYLQFVTQSVVQAALQLGGVRMEDVDLVPTGRGALWPDIWGILKGHLPKRFRTELLFGDLMTAKGSVALGAIDWADWRFKVRLSPQADLNAQYVIRIGRKLLLWDYKSDWLEGTECKGELVEVLTTNLDQETFNRLGLPVTTRFFTCIGYEEGLVGTVRFKLEGGDAQAPFAVVAITEDSKRVLASLVARAGQAGQAPPRWPMGRLSLPSKWENYR